MVGSIVPGKGIATIGVAELFLICFVRSYIIQCCLEEHCCRMEHCTRDNFTRDFTGLLVEGG